MDYDTKIAFHEAAHVFASCHFGLGSPEGGIDIHRPSSVDGAKGAAIVNVFQPTPDLSEEVRKQMLITNVTIAMAGPAADARTMGRTQQEALSKQPSDVKWATDEIAKSGLLDDAADCGKEEKELILTGGYAKAERLLSDPNNWKLVERLAKDCLANGGQLSKQEIEDILPEVAAESGEQ